METTLNDQVRQEGTTRDLVHSITDLVTYISETMTLLPGDVILTGTPAGVGPMQPGDTVCVTVEGIGALTNTVVAQ